MQGVAVTDDAYAFATDHLRSHDFDWYAALQFAPADKRAPLIALFAFLSEIARVRSLVSDPMPGEIRLQWWRDALSGTAHGAVEANPLAAALLGAIETHKIPRVPLLAALDARTFDLYDDAMPTTTDFEGYAGEVWSGPMALSTSLLSGHSAANFSDVAGHGGVALATSRVLEDFTVWSARGQCFLPTDLMAEHGLDRAVLTTRKPAPELAATLRAFAAMGLDHLDKAAESAAATQRAAAPVWLPLAFARTMLERATMTWADAPFETSLAVPRWRRLYRLWRASKRTPPF
jgi:phytoene synthase